MNALVGKYLKHYQKGLKVKKLLAEVVRGLFAVEWHYFLKTAVVLLFPFSCLSLLNVYNQNRENTTVYARNLTFIFNWLLLLCISLNDFSKADERKGAMLEIKQLLRALWKIQSFKRNSILLLACAAKSCYIGFYFLYYNSKKYSFMVNPGLVWWKICIVLVLLSPYFVMVLMTSKIYFVNHLIKHCFLRMARDLKDW